MILDKDYIKDLIELHTQTNGKAYADNKNVIRAISEAEKSILKEAIESLHIIFSELREEVTTELSADWFSDEIAQEKATARKNALEAIKRGETAEVSQEVYWEFLEAVPPLEMADNKFIYGECYSGNKYFEFFHRDGKYYGRLTEVKRNY